MQSNKGLSPLFITPLKFHKGRMQQLNRHHAMREFSAEYAEYLKNKVTTHRLAYGSFVKLYRELTTLQSKLITLSWDSPNLQRLEMRESHLCEILRF